MAYLRRNEEMPRFSLRHPKVRRVVAANLGVNLVAMLGFGLVDS
jgi:hypothetical protein